MKNESLANHKDHLFRGKEKSRSWRFWDHGVTSSFLGNFSNCLEQTRLHYVEGWQSRKVPLAFEFGTCVHWVLEQAYTFLMNEGQFHPDRSNAEYWMDLYQKKWLADVENPTKFQLEQQEMIYGMAERLLDGYFKRWSGDFNGGNYPLGGGAYPPAEWVSLEEVFDIPYTFADGRTTHIRGRRDGVYRTKKGEVFVFDTKCRSVINEDDALATLPYDLQQMLYCWVTSQQMQSGHIPAGKAKYPVGVSMNILRRPGQRFLVSDNLQSYLTRVEAEVTNPKKFDHYFIRYEMRLTPREIEDFKTKILDPLMRTVRLWWEGKIPHFMNPNALISKYGRCGMFDGIVNNDFSQCYRREVPFAELADGA